MQQCQLKIITLTLLSCSAIHSKLVFIKHSLNFAPSNTLSPLFHQTLSQLCSIKHSQVNLTSGGLLRRGGRRAAPLASVAPLGAPTAVAMPLSPTVAALSPTVTTVSPTVAPLSPTVAPIASTAAAISPTAAAIVASVASASASASASSAAAAAAAASVVVRHDHARRRRVAPAVAARPHVAEPLLARVAPPTSQRAANPTGPWGSSGRRPAATASSGA